MKTPPALAPSLYDLVADLAADAKLSRLINAVGKRRSAQLDGVWGSAVAALTSVAAQQFDPLLVVCPLPSVMDAVAGDLQLFTDRTVWSYPSLDSRPNRVLQDENYGERLRTLKQLLRGDSPAIVVTTIQSLLQPAPSVQEIGKRSRQLRVGDALDVDQLATWLADNQYHTTSAVELPGEFSRRGGIVDLFATDWEHPVRVELFGDTIDSLRQFDVGSQRSLESLAEIELTVLHSETNDHQPSGCLTEYLPEQGRVVVVEPDDVQHHGQHFLERSDAPDRLLGLTALLQRLKSLGQLTVGNFAPSHADETYRLPVESVERFSGNIGRVRTELDEAAAGQRVYLVVDTDAEIQRLDEILSTTAIAQAERLTYVVGQLSAGFHHVTSNTFVISGNELFHRAMPRRTARRRVGKVIDSFLDLRDGDLVVHLAHGIARFRGMRLLEKEGHVEEHLELEFHGGTRIFVPATKIDLVQKYVGARRAMPRLATIGGKSWTRQKQAAERAVEDLAADMLQVQAERASSPGIRFGEDTEWQREFDAIFPYTETADQLLAMEAIKADMTAPRPMDRLICGDVGFGKTELAMRAAFKAVDNGYQVAVLVPTTILAEQHFRTFTERMAEFPFTIAKLSRFCSTAEQRESIKALKAGGVDIVIGTHRLASKDVKFENLGLLVIDEEQRFGVDVKERLKAIRSTVDVLTLSATPIPRTLHMSLTGIRDISNLETPPADRVAVETRVTRWSHELIGHAIAREMNRGGQVYFVHNRIGDIESIRSKLNYIVPEASIAIGHGQMPEGQLEKVMVDFVNGVYDVLLATTIVESGLDIPNANTIFIDDAHRYGLADLHQLRGRVGRYKHHAYCYLLVDPDRSLTPTAARRLRAIEEFSDMGAGFSIAMRDLEIRGAGNVLGTAQSGHISHVGYELYCQLLESAVRRIQQLPAKIRADVDIELPGEAYIPRDYVPDMRIKIDLYRRLSRSVSDDDIAQMRAEFVDRFGPLPVEVQRLLALAKLKTEAAFWQLSSIYLEPPYLVCRFQDRGRADQLVKSSAGQLRRVDGQSLYMTLTEVLNDADQLIQHVTSVLRCE